MNTLLFLTQAVINMHWFFILPLVVVLVSAYICQHSADEIVYLSGAVLLVSLVLSLVLAPWPLQALLLLFVLFNRLGSSQPQEPPVKLPEEEKVKLIYRGRIYERTPPSVEPPDTELSGKYRGRVWLSRS